MRLKCLPANTSFPLPCPTVDLLTSQGKAVPKPTITLPPLFTPPGTQVTVQGPPPAAQQAAQLPPQLQQLLKAQAAAQAAQAAQAQGKPLGPARPPAGPAASSPTKASAAKENGSGDSKAATVEASTGSDDEVSATTMGWFNSWRAFSPSVGCEVGGCAQRMSKHGSYSALATWHVQSPEQLVPPRSPQSSTSDGADLAFLGTRLFLLVSFLFLSLSSFLSPSHPVM